MAQVVPAGSAEALAFPGATRIRVVQAKLSARRAANVRICRDEVRRDWRDCDRVRCERVSRFSDRALGRRGCRRVAPTHGMRSVIAVRSAAARSPAVRSGRKIEFRDVGSRPYQIVLRVGEPPRAGGRPHMHEKSAFPLTDSCIFGGLLLSIARTPRRHHAAGSAACRGSVGVEAGLWVRLPRPDQDRAAFVTAWRPVRRRTPGLPGCPIRSSRHTRLSSGNRPPAPARAGCPAGHRPT